MPEITASRFRRSLRGRRVLATSLAVAVASAVVLLVAPPDATAAGFTGGLSPTVFDNKMDLNGDNEPNSADDSNEFFGDTSIIDGMLDCDAWGPGTENAGVASENNAGTPDGSGTIDSGDDCTLIAYNGTATGQHIQVTDGQVQLPDGPMPAVYPDCDGTGGCNDSSVVNAKFAWQTINGRVDADGNDQINGNDCHFGIIGTANILSNTQADTNPCGFGSPHPTAADDGLVDLNADNTITSADSCTGCFFRHSVSSGFVGSIPAAAGGPAFTGGFSPTIVGGGADVNGDGAADGSDDSNEFFGSTSIIDGFLDCGNWTSTNDGTAGNGTIGSEDDCNLLGYDGSPSGRLIQVIDGEFQTSDGQMPTVYPDPSQPTNNDVSDSAFAWEAIGGRVDTNGNEFIDTGDCTIGIIGQTNILSNTSTDSNPCGFGSPHPTSADNGMVDLNHDNLITSLDSCTDNCFFGHNVKNGLVQLPPCICADFNLDSIPDILYWNKNTGSTSIWYMGGANGAVRQSFASVDPNGVSFPSTAWMPVAATDFDGDQVPDILYWNKVTGRTSIWYMGGTNGSVRQSFASVDPNGASFPAPRWIPVAAADFDGDGAPDILYWNKNSGATSIWYMGGPNGNVRQTFASVDTSGAGYPSALRWVPVATGDFNRDGVPDILYWNKVNGRTSIWYMGGTNGRVRQSSASVDPNGVSYPGGRWIPVAAADFNGDGVPDILYWNIVNGRTSIWFMGGPNGRVRQSFASVDTNGAGYPPVQWVPVTA